MAASPPRPTEPVVPARGTARANGGGAARRRLAAGGALALAAAALSLAVVVAIASFPGGLFAIGGLVLGLVAGLHGVMRRGARRALGLGTAAVLAVAVLIVVIAWQPLLVILAVATLALSLAAARAAFRIHVPLPRAPTPRHPVLFFNPRSGGGKAERLHVPEEARRRGIEPIELVPGSDLGTLARDAVARGADALAMAGGDGSQAIVAAIAAEHGLPYACIPAGTRNHFALDLGVDRNDVVGALDAFVDGGERLVDLADVNGRVFVNNVSLGLYAEAVQREGYRDAKLRTLLDTVPDVVDAADDGRALRWRDPDGGERPACAAILVSNNQYRLGQALGSGTRPRMDGGVLGIAEIAPAGRAGRPWREWTTPAFDVTADEPVPAGIDGEAVRLDPPLRFRVRPGALRVRIAAAHPAASPSALAPDNGWDAVRALAGIAAGRDPRPLPEPVSGASSERRPRLRA